MNPLVARALSETDRRGWLRPGTGIVAACSGGPDSTFLLRTLAEARESRGVWLSCLHVHHGIRGAEADADAAFVQALAGELDVPFSLRRVDVMGERAKRRGSVETVARAMRYRAFVEEAAARGFPFVATAHHRDDLAETVLLGLLRGGGLRAIQGIPPEREISKDPPVRVIRPLLAVSREEILAWLRERGHPFREDSSNLDAGPLRNRIRRELLPALRSIVGPSTETSLARLGEEAREADALVLALAEDFLTRAQGGPTGGIALPVEGLGALARPVRLRALREAFARVGAGPASLETLERCEEVLAGEESRIVPGPGRSIAVREGGYLRIRGSPPAPEEPGRYALPVPGEVDASDYGLHFRAWFEESPPDLDALGPLDQAFDATAISGSLEIRSRRPGDRFHPLGAAGTRKVSDFLIDVKVPRSERDRVPLLVSGDRLLWVVGHRIDERFRVGERTTRVLRVHVVRTP